MGDNTILPLHGVPRPLDVELPRLRLVDRLRGRWALPVTLVVAGPGFGKTTALAQAVRANLLEPRGIDAWVSCEAAHEDADRLARSILDALAVRARPGVLGVRDVVDALIRHAPLDVCLLLDDVHEVPEDSPGAELLGSVVRALPGTAHLVLSGRRVPSCRLARREAAGEVAGIDSAELAFTEAETAALAGRFGREPPEDLRGWPALVRLSLTAGPAASWRYAREEVLSRLPGPVRLTLAALVTLGSATAGELAAVVGKTVPVEGLVRWVPLVDLLDDGRYRAHDLWADPVARMVPMEALRTRAVEVLCARGDLARAGSVACRAQDWGLLARLAVDLVRTTLSVLPRVTADRWLSALPADRADGPAFLLLRAAAAHARDFADRSIDELVDDAWQKMLAAGDQDGAAVALGQAVITAHSRGDLVRLVVVAQRAGTLDTAGSPVLRLLRHSVAAVLAELAGDPEEALVHLAQAPVSEVPPALAVSTTRFHVHCLSMCGRGRDAAELAEQVLDDDLARRHATVARWFDGEVGEIQTAGAGGTARDEFVAQAFRTVIAASFGETSTELPCGDPAEKDNPRDAVLACAAQAAVAVTRGDEELARDVYKRHLTKWPVDVKVAERHLRRFLTLGYVLSDELRERWDNTDLGPSHQKARAAGRVFVRARQGDLQLDLPEAHALCFLPLPWSVELAVRLAVTGRTKLGAWLADHAAVHQKLRELTRDPDLAAGAAKLLTTVPTPPEHPIGIEVIGPMRVTRNGLAADAPELRRARVRQLLGLLVLRTSISRDQAIDLLWPGLDPSSAARNLRVTMTHLRRLLEPGRAGGEASYHLRSDSETIRLVRSDRLTVDLWSFQELNSTEAVALWRGEPLPDLIDLCESEIAQITARHVHNLLALGELRLVTGDPAEACDLAERALALEPFAPRGHRLALAAALRARNPQRTSKTRARVLDSLRQLGVGPDAATEILLRQAVTRS
ncbi:BTAD domain-containing putative transcriptional regulator [Lentzea californiensis]|uniref:BTAD domain-containing putative transcriptional regulator n=1 Tax=Lentzea californiensis TaxID=438851 RepID=UPI0021666953|nr:BTAD domain-containing putative transcriptional regulator [Lentzea californiensis]MCR3751078.1 transcriptional activator domain-containing protein [Lentzea californiensis]